MIDTACNALNVLQHTDVGDFRSDGRQTWRTSVPAALPSRRHASASTHKLLSTAIFTLADKVKVHISAFYRCHEWGQSPY